MKLYLFISLLFCLAGCGYQIIDIGKRYFSYRTKKFVDVHILNSIKPPGVSICFSLSEMIFGVEYARKHSKEVYQFFDETPVSKLFAMTPSNESVLNPGTGCTPRFPDQMSWKFPWPDRKECHKLFSVGKYLYRLGICYKFTPNYGMNQLNTKHASLSPFIYTLYLNPDLFLGLKFITAYGHNDRSSPFYDSVFSIENTLKTNNSKFRVGLIATPITISKLRPPYDTKCRDGGDFKSGSEYSLHKLNIATMKGMNYVHTLEHVSHPYPFPILTISSFRNESLNDQFMNLTKEYEKLSFPVCRLEYNIPKTRIEKQDERISIVVNWPQDPAIHVKSVASQQVIDFIIYICSTVGIWLGLSVFTSVDMIVRSLSKRKVCERKVCEGKVCEGKNVLQTKQLLAQNIVISSHQQRLNRIEQKLISLSMPVQNQCPNGYLV